MVLLHRKFTFFRDIFNYMKKIKIIYVSAFLCVFTVFSFGGGNRDHAAGSKAKQTSVGPWVQPRIIPVYVVSKDAQKSYIEGLYVPQGIAAYYPNQFSMSGKERRIQFENQYSYRILEKHQVKADVWIYSVETSSTLNFPEHTKTFTIYFNRSALMAASGEAIQPATYALQRGARMSDFASGTVRLESLSFNEKDEQFKAIVVVSP